MDIEAGSFKQFIKTKPTSDTIHIKVTGDISSDSLFTIAVLAANSD